MRQRRKVQMHERQVQEEGPARRRVALHEDLRVFDRFGVNAAAAVEVVDLHDLRRLAAPATHSALPEKSALQRRLSVHGIK